jgi:hypothetical protein
MHADDRAEASRLVDGRFELFVVILVGRREDAVAQLIVSGLVDLDEVRALLMLLPDHRDELGRRIGVVGIRQHPLCGIEPVGVFMAAEYVDRIAAGAQTRSRDQPCIDRVAHGGVGGARALGSHVALGREAGHEIVPRGEHGQDRAFRHGLLDRLQILGARMQEQMHMRVDESRHQGHVAEVDDFGARGVRHARADRADALAGDENFTGLYEATARDIEQASGTQHERRRRWIGGARGLRGVQSQCERKRRAEQTNPRRGGPTA